jgi:hypothetical protein
VHSATRSEIYSPTDILKLKKVISILCFCYHVLKFFILFPCNKPIWWTYMCLYSDAIHDMMYCNFFLLIFYLSTMWLIIIAQF